MNNEQTPQTPTAANTPLNGAQGHNAPHTPSHAQRAPSSKPQAPRKASAPRPPIDPDAIIENPRAESEAFTEAKKAGKKQHQFALTNGKMIKGTLASLGRYTYTVDTKDAENKSIRLLLQKHAVLYVTIGYTPVEGCSPEK